MDMIRMEKGEEYFDREEVLGRDTSSVFPSLEKKAQQKDTKMPMMDAEQVEKILGTKGKFISASELQEMKEKMGDRMREEEAAPKSLAEQLQEHKDAKAAAKEEIARIKKQGKNRPLTEEELEFIESLEQEEELADKQIRFEERKALAAFQTAQIHAREQQQGEQEEPSSRVEPDAVLVRKGPQKRPAARARVVVKKHRGDEGDGEGKVRHGGGDGSSRRGENGEGGGVCASGGGEGRDGEDGSAGEEGRKGGGVDARSGEGLGVLLGGYGSDSESGSEKEPWNEEALG